jgi:glutamyl-tRNA reductase
VGAAQASRLPLRTVGISHRSATAALREKLLLEESAYGEVLRSLKADGIVQALVLSTCDRTEFTVAGADLPGGAAPLWNRLAAIGRLAPDAVKAQGYELADEAALRHLFAVAAALDSAVVGEPFVLGQVKAAHRESQAAGMTGPALEAALQAAYRAARRVRNETAIGERPVSLAAAVLQLARRVHGDLGGVEALLLGGGEMGELILEQLRQGGLVRVSICHRSEARGRLIAHRLGGHVRPWDDLAAALSAADILVAAVGDEKTTIDISMLRAALKARRRRPILCIDGAVPGDIDKAADRLDGIFLFDLGDLEKIALEGRHSRQAATAPAWAILDEELAAFARGPASPEGDAAVVVLRRHFEETRRQVLAESGAADAEAATRLLVNRLLHGPSTALRALAGDAGAVASALGLLCRLFGIAPSENPAGRKEDEQ